MARPVLEIAVLLLGASVDLQLLLVAGPALAVGIAVLVVIGIAASYGIGRAVGLPHTLALLVACGNAICGNSSADDVLFQKLRSHCKQLADSAGVPPYVIFHDATLRNIAERLPATVAQFATIPGVGQTRLDRYGESFTRLIRQHLGESG